MLPQLLQVAKHDHLVVLVSDLDGADEETRRLATRLAAHNDVLVIAIYDPLGASLVGAPGMWANDRGRRYQVPNAGAFAKQFQEAFQRRLDEWREIFRTLQVPVLPISTHQPVPMQIRSLFGSRS